MRRTRSKLSEGRLEDIRSRYPDLPDDVFEKLVSLDPSPTKKYVAWIVKSFIREHKGAGSTSLPSEGRLMMGRLNRWENDIRPSIEYFHAHNEAFKRRDINAYESFEDLENAVKNVTEKQAKKQRLKVDASEAEKLHDDGRVLLIRPDTKNAVMKYGSNTKWCITMAGTNYYDDYTKHDVLFYFLIRTDIVPEHPLAKVAFAVNRDKIEKGPEIFDAQDKSMSFARVCQDWPNAQFSDSSPAKFVAFNRDLELIKKLHDIINTDARSRPKCIEAKMYDRDPVTNDEVLTWWGKKFDHRATVQQLRKNPENIEHAQFGLTNVGNDMKKAMDSLTIPQQMLIATVEPYVKWLLCDEGLITSHGGSVSVNDLIWFEKEGSKLAWTCPKPTTIHKFDTDVSIYLSYKGSGGIATNVIGFTQAMWNDPASFIENVVVDEIKMSQRSFDELKANHGKGEASAFNERGERFTWTSAARA